MKKDHFKKISKLKPKLVEAYNSFDSAIDEVFSRLQESFNMIDCYRLDNLLQEQGHCKKLEYKSKAPIFKFFLERQISHCTLHRPGSNVILKILKATKCALEGYTLDWKAIWLNLLKQLPEIRKIEAFMMQEFLAILRAFYDVDNCLQVFQYFMAKHSEHKDLMFIFVKLFANIKANTSTEIYDGFIGRLIKCYHSKQITANSMITFFISVNIKRKDKYLHQEHFKHFNQLIIASLMTPNAKSGSIEGQLTKSNATMVYYLIGKGNPYSKDLIDTVFHLVGNYIHPFENSSKASTFLYYIIRALEKRHELQKHYRKQLAKLLDKEKNANEDDDNNDDEDNQNDSEDDQEPNETERQFMEIMVEEDDVSDESDDSKKDKYLQLLKNELTEDLIEALRANVETIFDDIFFVNSTKTIPGLLKYIFYFFPKLCMRGLELVEKAAEIPYIKEEGLLLNIKAIAQCMFSPGMEKQAVQNSLKILEKVDKCRKISDSWPIYEIICSKIPLLDEKDLSQVSEADKLYFEETFGLHHDRFYEAYSENVLEAFKRLIRQGEHFDDSNKLQFTAFEEIKDNSYPYFRKRLEEEILEIIVEQPNNFVFNYFGPDNLKSLNPDKDTEESIQLRLNLVMLLTYNYDLAQLKPYVREFAKRNHFNTLDDFDFVRVAFNVRLPANSSSLRFFEEDPSLELKEVLQYEKRIQNRKHLVEYSDEIIEELHQLLEGEKTDLQKKDYWGNIKKVYAVQEGTQFQPTAVEKRNTIAELLKILFKIEEKLSHKIIRFDSGKVVYEDVEKKQLLQNSKFMKVVDQLVYNTVWLQDEKISNSLSSIITSEVLWKYLDTGKKEQQNLQRLKKINRHKELPGNTNKLTFQLSYHAKVNMCLNYYLTNSTKKLISFEHIEEQLLMLALMHDNKKSSSICSIFNLRLKHNLLKDHILKFYELYPIIKSRFFWEKVKEIFDVMKTYLDYDPQELVGLIDRHVQIIGDPDKKIKDIGLESLKGLISVMKREDLSGQIQMHLRDYASKHRLELIWLLPLSIILTREEGRIHDPQKRASKVVEIEGYMQHLQKLMFSELRMVRRICLFLYSSCVRNLKKLVKYYEVEKVSSAAYEPKTLEEFFESIYLRKEHINNPCVKNKMKLKKIGPYEEFQVYKQHQLKEYDQAWDSSYKFLLESEDKALKFMNNFHSDMAANSTQLASLAKKFLMNKNDLPELVFKVIEENYFLLKFKDLNFERSEVLYGEKFFKYLLIRDGESYGFDFFSKTKHIVVAGLGNMDSLDNRFLVMIYLNGLVNAYGKHHKAVSAARKAEVEEFVLLIVSKAIDLWSGTQFKSLLYTLNKIEDKAAFCFLTRHLEKLLDSKQKICRASQIYLCIYPSSVQKMIESIHSIWENNLELENSYTQKLITLTLTDYITIDYETIKKYNIFDIDRYIEEGRLVPMHTGTYAICNPELNSFFTESLGRQMKDVSGHKVLFNKVNILLKAYSSAEEGAVTTSMVTKLIECALRIKEQSRQIEIVPLESNLRSLVSHLYLDVKHYLSIVRAILENLQRITVNKYPEILGIVANTCTNLYSLPEEMYQDLLGRMLHFERYPVIYKQLMVDVSTLLSYRKLDTQTASAWVEKLPEGQCILYHQANLLASMTIDTDEVSMVLKSGKDRRNIWCKQISLVRGKREYLDDEQKSHKWSEIKSYSNTYNYIA